LSAERPAPRLRRRLLLAFVLVGVPPVVVLAFTISSLISRRFEERASERLQQALATVEDEMATLAQRAERAVAAVVAEDLPAVGPRDETGPTLASELARRRDLPALEIVDRDGRIISSHHWPAGFGLPDVDVVFPPEPTLRFEKVAEGYGAGERLVLMPARDGVLWGSPVTVRGGPFLDAEFLGRLSRLMGTEVGFHEETRGQWVTPAGSAFLEWRAPRFPPRPASAVTLLGERSYQWAATPLRPGLWLVVGTPRTELDTVIGQVRRFTLVIGAAALLVCLTAALALSARIARPVRELARGARRVAGGDLSGSVEVAGVGEVRDLARAFNQMTEELRSSRARLIQAERVAAWREMARRLAHELKNPLFPIQLSIETLERAAGNEAAKPEAGGSGFVSLFRDSSQTILAELRALRKVIDEFSEFARMPRPQPRPIQVNDVVERVLGLYRARSGGVQVHTRLDPRLPDVDLDPDLLARALGNLVANALESMHGAGRLELRTGRSAAAVTIAVEDSGPGLTEEQRSGLFSPYFTTKEGGTGLGLAIVQGIVSDHGGRVEVSGEPGRGTTFTLVLPAPSVSPDS